MSSKKAGGAGAAAGAKSKAKAKDSAAAKEECVAYIFDLLFAHLDRHIDDKRIFPQTLAYAVSRTTAEMVHMVSIAHVQRMEDWLVHLEGSAPEEWDKPQEPLIPMIDSWARGVIPLREDTASRSSSVDLGQQQEAQAQENAKQPRRASAMALSQYQDSSASRRRSSNSNLGLRGSLRRFSDSVYPLDPNRKVKFEEKTPDEVQKGAPPGRRSSTPPPSDFFQGVLQDTGAPKGNATPEISPKKSLSQEDKVGKGKKAKEVNSAKK